ncbi:UDP-glucuronic acid decarboxylase family protein [Sandaracinus amylolyticus]|uniref:dTDP-glucose 4,6-dehydratase n=1 Tax=Sandaracinus amylolyticus TaxID=927083 RepID=A0A0F6W4D3_9BACT|nr:UDP-glucuronic acid decarboxylase family protein [Sandaracinus amylolyticus]AKF06983.1 dTDP-glucose 4,6-dehydratase [Sandaracinus amylolyticus]
MTKRALVTGGAGFVGSHLCDRLLELGHEVVALDNFYTGTRDNLTHLRSHARFSLVEQDVIEPLPALGGRFDWVFNLACPASPPHYQRDPIFTTKTSFLGTLHGLERASADGARFFQASTSEVYGDPEVHPQPETYRGSVNTLGPRACYDEGKRVAESLCMDFHRTRGLEVRIVRIFNTYGPRMDPNDGRVVSNFIVQALRGEPLTVYGEGKQTRSFCFVSDLIDGFLLLMQHPDTTGPVNIGNDGEFTMLELAELVRELTGSRSPIVHRPLPADDPTQRRPDLTVARERLGFRHRVPLREGLARTIEYFARHTSEPQRSEASA